MTNHNALARQFTISDNFYMEPEASGVGHRWLVGVQPDNFCQMLYTLGWSFKLGSTAPGRRASFGSNGSIALEDYPEAGSMWEHLAHYGVPFRNYGEGFEFADVKEDEGEHRTGAREVVNIPMSKVLYDNTCREFPIFNMNIPRPVPCLLVRAGLHPPLPGSEPIDRPHDGQRFPSPKPASSSPKRRCRVL